MGEVARTLFVLFCVFTIKFGTTLFSTESGGVTCILLVNNVLFGASSRTRLGERDSIHRSSGMQPLFLCTTREKKQTVQTTETSSYSPLQQPTQPYLDKRLLSLFIFLFSYASSVNLFCFHELNDGKGAYHLTVEYQVVEFQFRSLPSNYGILGGGISVFRAFFLRKDISS